MTPGVWSRASRRGIALVLALAVVVMAMPAARAEGAPDAKRAVVVLEYRAGSDALQAVDRRVAEILRKRTSLEVLDADDARKKYGRDLDRKLVGCSGDAGCIAAIGRDMDVREVVLIGVSQFGDVILTLQRIDTGNGRVISRVAEAMAQGADPDDAALLSYLQRVMPKGDFLRYGVIRIVANVEGATVSIGGRERGQTPVEPIRVRAPATYDIHLTKPGFVPFRASVAVPPDAEVRVDPELEPKRDAPWYTRWWFITTAGTVVAGSVALFVILSEQPDDVPVVVRP